jgi:hypothetical protein
MVSPSVPRLRMCPFVGENPIFVVPPVLQPEIDDPRGFFCGFLALKLLFVVLPVWFVGRWGVQ